MRRQTFLATHAAAYNTFNVQRHLIRRTTLRLYRAEADRMSAAATAAIAARQPWAAGTLWRSVERRVYRSRGRGLLDLARTMTRGARMLCAAVLGILCAGLEMPAIAKPGVVAFYVPWDAAGRIDLAAHMSAVNVFAPFWIALKTPDGLPTVTSDDDTSALITNARSAPMVMPVVANAHDGIWDGATADAVIARPESRAALIAALTKLASEKKYSGYVFDMENLSPASVAALPQFVSAVQAAFAPAHLETWLTVPLGSADWPIRALQDAGATVVLMAYDQCWANSTPGPIAADDWFGPTLAARMQGLDASKTVIALGNYAYDWPKGMRAKVLSVDQAMQLAHDNRATVSRTAPQWNPIFTYSAPDGVPHVVWMLDGATFSRQWATASRYSVKGIALWRLGLEDAAMWKATPSAPIRATAAQVPSPVCSLLPAP